MVFKKFTPHGPAKKERTSQLTFYFRYVQTILALKKCANGDITTMIVLCFIDIVAIANPLSWLALTKSAKRRCFESGRCYTGVM